MSKRKKKKTHSPLYYVILVVVFTCFLAFMYDRFFANRVNDSYDIKLSKLIASAPKDILIKDYDSYKSLLNQYLTKSKYNEIINKDKINEESFDKYDYIVLFYESTDCTSSVNYVNKIEKLKSKMILTVRSSENECDKSTIMSFIPIKKDEYNEVPSIVIRKEIVKK